MSSHRKTPAGGEDREDRLKQALKANLQRRKAQARARSEGSGPDGQAAPDEADGTKGAAGQESGQDG